MNEPWLMVLDAGTMSTRAMLYAPDGTLGGMAQRALEQHYPRPGWVEHDAREILDSTLACARELVAQAGGPGRIAAIGITNQRETVVAWDKRSGAPVSHAIVWQDRRTAAFCDHLREAGHEAEVQRRTGLLLDPYFSAGKMHWLLDNVPDAKALGGNLAFGTVETWLVWNLTGGLHVSDATNACRTSLLALDGASWDEGLCDLFGVPPSALPEVVDCAGQIGTSAPDVFGSPIPITALVGDQQSATIGQGCLTPGDTKATFGTGAFILTNMGEAVPHSRHRLLGTVLSSIGGKRTYALEGSIFAAGSAIKWLRDNLGLLETAPDSEALARSVPDAGGVVFVPALAGMGAPHWRPDATASLTGMTFATRRAHIVRAALEAMAHQCHDLKEAFSADGASWTTLRIDGGMSGNDWVAQDLADILDLPCERPVDVETTARGAALLAAIGAGIYPDLESAKAMLPPVSRFTPEMGHETRNDRLLAWHDAVAHNLQANSIRS